VSGRAATPRAELVPRLEDQGYSDVQIAERRAWIEAKTGARLAGVGACTIPGEQMRGNIENPIGSVQVPLGVAGPLRVEGEHARGTFYVPMATTEGTLVRSYERGAVTVTRAGGAVTRLYADENRVAPVFLFEDITEAYRFARDLDSLLPALREQAEATTRHGRLLRLEIHPVGRQVMVHFCFSTGDAHGMNMIVRATERACEWLVAQGHARRYYIFSGLDAEKHASASLLTGGKGKKVVAGARLPAPLVRAYLGSTPERLLDLWHCNVLGQLHSGSTGCNAHYANGLAALFIACGQDVANLVNSAAGLTHFEVTPEGDLHLSVTLTSLTLATVGGGTALGTAPECLEMLGCLGTGKAVKLAEIAAAFLLAGELSFCAAIASGEFVASHETYGRNRPVEVKA